MPGLEIYTEGVVARISQTESIAPRMLYKPLIRLSFSKFFAKGIAAQCSEVDSAPAVMLTVAGSCIHSQNRLYRLPLF